MMLEADALANRIAIVKKGRLRVVGTQQHLKVSCPTQCFSSQLQLFSPPCYIEHLR